MAALPEIWPPPQQVVESGSRFAAGDFTGADLRGAPVVARAMTEAEITPVGKAPALAISNAGGDGEKFRAAAGNLPAVAGAYRLEIAPRLVRMTAFDDTGLFYAQQTLAQMIRTGSGSVPGCKISDWPDVPFRGTVEGFYGAPWKHSARLEQIRFYGRWKLNTYIYGPKDDPFHGFSNRWREPYPADKAAQIKELAQVAAENHVNFVWAVHPGADIHWTDNDGDGTIDDFKACVAKFQMMHDLGVRAFAVFFDDIGGEGARPERQVEMLNYLNREFVKKTNAAGKGDVAPLVMCPTQYSGTSDSPYIRTLGDKLDKDISIMWTGPGICSDIPAGPTARITGLIKRPPYVWWNWPVVDYCRTALLLGRAYGPDKDNKGGKYAGFVSNPMDKPEASKIALFGVAAYTWNIGAFDSDASWKAGIRLLFPGCAPAMQTFANHNSDQGPNAHGYRREESVEFQPVIEAARKEYAATGKFTAETSRRLLEEFARISRDGKVLLQAIPKANPDLFHEIEFWVRSFTSLGDVGTAVVRMVNATDTREKFIQANLACRGFGEIQDFSASQKERASADTTEKDRHWSKGCKTAALWVSPFVETIFAGEWAKTHAALAGKAGGPRTNASYKAFSNVPTLKNIQAERDGKYVNVSRILEVIKLEPGQYIGLELPPGVFGNYVHVKLDNPRASEAGIIEISKEGSRWEKLATRNNGQEMHNDLDVKREIRFFRYINTSAAALEIKLNQFKFDVPADSAANSPDAMYDGDANSAYAISSGEIVASPIKPAARQVIVLSPHLSNIGVLYADGTKAPYNPATAGGGKPVRGIQATNPSKPVRIHEIIWRQ